MKRASARQTSQKKAVSNHRRRLKRSGIARLEVRVRNEDASLVRDVLAALADPERAQETRTLLREHFPPRKALGLKALLASAPLGGIDLTRVKNGGRSVDL